MAVDTANKRYSFFGFGDGAAFVAPVPDGTVGTQDRAHWIRLYAGIALAEPTEDAVIRRSTVLFGKDPGARTNTGIDPGQAALTGKQIGTRNTTGRVL